MDKNRLHCGVAKHCLTPEPEIRQHLVFRYVHDDIFVRVIALRNEEKQVLIVSFDMTNAPDPDELVEEICEKTGIPADSIMCFGTHTHSAPNAGKKTIEHKKRSAEYYEAKDKYTQWVKQITFTAVEEALQNMLPAKMGYGYGTGYININRNQDYHYKDENGVDVVSIGLGNDGSRPIDHTLFVMSIVDCNEKPLAFLINFPMHNVVMIGNVYAEGRPAQSSDVGGNVCQLIEQQYEGAVAIWSSGAAGDSNPLMMNQNYYPDPHTGKSVNNHVTDFATSAFFLKMMTTRHLADVKKVLSKIKKYREAVSLGSVVEVSRTPGKQGDYCIRLQLVRIGELSLFGISGELYSSHALAIKEKPEFPNTVIVTHNVAGEYKAGYIFDDDTLTRYEASVWDQNNFVPGIKATNMVKGYVRDSLMEHLDSMRSKVFSD